MRRGFLFFGFAVLGLIGYRYYAHQFSPTRIGFINYRSFQLARIEQASKKGTWVRIESLPIEEAHKAHRYDAIFIFGRGFQMSPDQLKALERAGYKGTHLYVEGATNANMDITNLRGQDLDYVGGYLKYDGSENYKNLLNYVRTELDEKRFFIGSYEAPKKRPRDVFFYLEDAAIFGTHEAFVAYAQSRGFHKDGQPKIALVTSVPGPFNTNREHVDALIQKLADKGYNVYPMASALKRLPMLKAIAPDMVLFMPHGRLTLGQGEAATQWLKKQNIPMLTPLSVFEPYETWIKSLQGMFGPLLTMSVVLPELDGGIVPYTINTLYPNEKGYDIFNAIPERLNTFVSLVDKWFVLRHKPNSEKKIAIYYFKGPGLSTMVAANMEVIPSLYRTLKTLKASGYKVEGLPTNVRAFKSLLMRQGAVLGPYAKGAFDVFLKEGSPALVPVETYLDWVKRDLNKASYARMVNEYGEAPGDYLSVYQSDSAYLAVARARFGNVVLLPQPLPGIGDNTFELIHGTEKAPPHPYVASYLWTRHAFEADAVIHFGTHGSLEFTPSKQIALSGNDWSDALIGQTPHFYVYTVSNVGEAIIAKRRSYATTISHLTPPFIQGDLQDGWRSLRQKLWTYTQANGAVKAQYAQNISDLARKEGIYADLNFDPKQRILDEDAIFRLTAYVEEVANEKITAGLYTLGEPYSASHIHSTVELMAVDPLAHSMASLDVVTGKTTHERLRNSVYFEKAYRRIAKRHIKKVLKSPPTPSHQEVLADIVSASALEKAHRWRRNNKKLSDMDIVRTFIGMRHPLSHAPHAVSRETSDKELEQVKALVVRILPFEAKCAFINDLRSEKLFRKYSGILDPETMKKARIIARAVPKMDAALDVAEDPDVMALLRLMQKETLYQKTFAYMADNTLLDRAQAEKKAHIARIKATCSSEEKKRFLTHLGSAFENRIADWDTTQLTTLQQGLHFYKKHASICQEELKDIELDAYIENVEARLAAHADKEARFARAVLKIEESLVSLAQLKTELEKSPERELKALVNGLNGGYVSASAGGDIIANPYTLPTGRNLYAIDAEKTPSEEAWRVGVQMAEDLLKKHQAQNGSYPKKVSFTLWPSDFIRTEGALVAQILYLLGVEAVRDPYGRVMDVRLVASRRLGRPRIDVVVQTAGQFRDLAASRLFLIHKAVELAARATDATANYVTQGVKQAETHMKKIGFSPKDAKELATARIFGGINGNYGTNIMGMVEKGDGWESDDEVAQTYLHNMGAIYTDENRWGAFEDGVFEAALLNTEVVIQPRESNTWGALSLDHVYEFMGGLNLAVRQVTGKEPAAYFNDFRNPLQPKMQEISEAISVEARSTLLNPRYIKAYMKGGASAAEKFAEIIRNTYGWDVMKTQAIDEELWNRLHDVYVRDSYDLGVHRFFERENPYALQEMTAVMLETIRKGYWRANKAQIQALVALHSRLIKGYKAACSNFVCNNTKLSAFISDQLTHETTQSAYLEAIGAAREGTPDKERIVMAEKTSKEIQSDNQKNLLNMILWIIGTVLIVVLIGVFIRRRKKEN